MTVEEAVALLDNPPRARHWCERCKKFTDDRLGPENGTECSECPELDYDDDDY